MNTINPGEIVYARITTSTIARKGKPAKKLTAPPIVFSASWAGYNTQLQYTVREDRMTINKFGVKEDLVIVKMEIVSRHGYRNKQEKSNQL